MTVLRVSALCAEWCGTCREYRPLFDAQAQRFGDRVRFAWIDIEDHDEVLGTIDVDNFPTLLVARDDEVLFFGTVTPHAQTLARLVQSALDGDLMPLADEALRQLARRARDAPSTD